ncbi:MAG: polymorphic toxin type 37 domain-containing protein [Candidatus Dependentiae bacterium]|nr:polymorphic toxin type 37 domain-containing protein [Candidatus Dependentiae bacterium]
MKIVFKVFLLIATLFQYESVLSHGFAGLTLVSLQNNQNLLPIKDISSKFFKGQKTTVGTYKEKSKQWKTKPVQAVAYCQSNAFFELDFVSSRKKSSETITCSPLQLFYRASDMQWIPAHELRDGDELLCRDNAITKLQSKKQVFGLITLYIIEVKKHHTFAVGRQNILTHNMFIPIATTIGMSVPFDIVLGAGTFACMFGPVSFCCSVAAAGIAAAITYQCGKKKHTDFNLVLEPAEGCNFKMIPDCFEQKADDAQAPGLPAEKDGFVPPKNWNGEKIRHPITGQVGWPDKKGNVWKPTGVGPLAHGGPHWDVISNDGKRHWNIMPGGKERGSK